MTSESVGKNALFLIPSLVLLISLFLVFFDVLFYCFFLCCLITFIALTWMFDGRSVTSRVLWHCHHIQQLIYVVDSDLL